MARAIKSLYIQPGSWVKGKMIGSGSFGSVHLALNKANGLLFVVKSSKSRIGLNFLENEANILMGLNSPYVVKCFGKETSHGQNGEYLLNIFMEHMGGGSLSDVADKFGGKLSEGVIRSYTREILIGLNHLHENGILHGDIKCKNVLLDSYGNVKLADFGCAKKVDHDLLEEQKNKSFNNFLELNQCISGSPLWMAPEILRGERLDYVADIWSLGCTIIEMATGKPPSWGNDVSNPMAMIMKIAQSNEKPQFPNKLSKEGFDFLEKCLERNTKKRWTAKELLHHPFISGNGEDKMNGQDASTPASVLDIGKYEMGFSDYEDDGSDIDNEPCLSSRIGVSLKINVDDERKGLEDSFLNTKIDLETSGNWITVRSAT